MSTAEDDLTNVRKAIDGIDGALMELLARRFDEVKKVIALKQQLGLPAFVPARADAVVARARASAQKVGFPPDTAAKIWTLLIDEMCKYEEAHL